MERAVDFRRPGSRILLSFPLHFVVQRVNMHWGSAGKRWAEGTSAQLAACVDYSRLQIPFPTDGGRKRGKQSPLAGFPSGQVSPSLGLHAVLGREKMSVWAVRHHGC